VIVGLPDGKSCRLLRYGVLLGAGSGSVLLYFDSSDVSDSNMASRVVPLQDSKLEAEPGQDLGHEQCVRSSTPHLASSRSSCLTSSVISSHGCGVILQRVGAEYAWTRLPLCSGERRRKAKLGDSDARVGGVRNHQVILFTRRTQRTN
jgi:hypothetical protein